MKNQEVSFIKNIFGKRSVLYYLLIAFGILEAVSSVMFAMSIKDLINAVEFSSGKNAVIRAVIFSFSFVLVSFLCDLCSKILSSKTVTENEITLKKGIFEKYIKGSLSTIEKTPTGDLLSRLSGDLSSVVSVYSLLVPSLTKTLFQILAVLVALLLLEPLYTLVLVFAGVIVYVFTLLVRKAVYKIHTKTSEADAELTRYITETRDNSLIVKAYESEDFISKKGDVFFKNNYDKRLKRRYVSAGVSSFTSFLFTAFYCLTVVWGAVNLINGSGFSNFGVTFAMLQLLMQVKGPIASMSGYITAYTEMKASAKRLHDIILEETTEKTDYNGGFESLTVQNVSFSYRDNKVLDNVSLTVNKGDKVLIKGESGGGKTTLLKIICSLLESEGNVFVTVNGKTENAKNYKNLFSFVPQGNMLFTGTVKENIVFSSENVSDSEVLNAVEVANLNKFVDNLPNGIDTQIGDKGSQISGGEAQRLSVARALCSKRPIIVLDEFTSALDTQTEISVLNALSKIEGLTVIAVSHRNLDKLNLSKVYTLSNGKLI